MKSITTISLLFTLLINSITVNAQVCNDCRYISPIFDSVTVETVLFAEGMNSDSINQQLYMDIFQPYGDTLSNRPIMIFAFGGGFVQGSKDDWYVQAVCKYFAQAGYVTAAVDYRIGINYAEIIAGNYIKIIFRPMQDMRAAIQYFKADYSELGNNYNVDTSKVILGGGSAGGITALMVTYCDKMSEIAQLTDTTVMDDMGGFYSTSGFYDHYSWRPSAVVNVAGALFIADFIEPGDPPVISLHGDADDVVPYADGTFFGLGIGLQGSYIIDSVATAKGVCSYLYTMEGEGHPSENKSIDYYTSKVNLLLLRMHAVINERSFCCDLNVNITPEDTAYWEHDPITLTADITNDNGNAQLKWCSIPCSEVITSSQITLQPDTVVEYVAAVVYEGNCQAVDLNVIKQGPVSIDEIKTDINQTIKIFPNPVTDIVEIVLENSQEATISLKTINGRNLFSKEINSNNTKLDLSSYPSGYYLLIVNTEDGIAVKKLVK